MCARLPGSLLLGVFGALVSLTACGGGGDGAPQANPAGMPPPTASPPPSVAPPPPPTVAFSAVDTLAGQYRVRGGQDGKGSDATFNYPVGLAATGAAGASNGETLLYIAALNEAIRYEQVGYADNPVGTAIGGGSSGSVDGDAQTALVRAPQGIAVGYDSDAYEAYAYWTEDDSCVVRKLTRYPLNGNRQAMTIAGKAYECGTGDGPATSARFNRPKGILANRRTGEVFVVDSASFTLRRIYGQTVTTVAGAAGQSGSTDGAGASARFRYPQYIAMDKQENLYLTDGSTVRLVTPAGVVTTYAGKGDESGYQDGSAGKARFGNLQGIALDEFGNVYLADPDNHCIRRITVDGTVSTLAGVPAVAGAADGNLSAATFDSPVGLAYYNKQLFVADEYGQTIRRIR
jgi:hypothetical protein